MDIKERRKSINVKLNYAAQMIGISTTTLMRWEKGKYDPLLSQMKRAARILKVNIDELFFNGIESDNQIQKVKPQIITLRRKAMRLQLFELAAMLGVSRKTLGKIERGEVDIRFSLINKIHEILGLSIQELVKLQVY